MIDPFEIPDFLKRDTPERRAAFDEARRNPAPAASSAPVIEADDRPRYHNGIPLPRTMTPEAWAILRAMKCPTKT